MSKLPGYNIGESLAYHGLKIPEECANIELLIPPDGLMQLRYTVNLSIDEIPPIVKTLMDNLNESQRAEILERYNQNWKEKL